MAGRQSGLSSATADVVVTSPTDDLERLQLAVSRDVSRDNQKINARRREPRGDAVIDAIDGTDGLTPIKGAAVDAMGSVVADRNHGTTQFAGAELGAVSEAPSDDRGSASWDRISSKVIETAHRVCTRAARRAETANADDVDRVDHSSRTSNLGRFVIACQSKVVTRVNDMLCKLRTHGSPKVFTSTS